METNKEFYDVLTQIYLRSALESRLMLDEDIEVVLSDYFDDVWCEHYYKPSILFTFGGLTAVLTTYLSKKIDVPFLFLPSIVISSFTLLYELKGVIRKKANKRNIPDLMKAFNSLRTMNNAVIKYLKTRHDIKASNTELMFQPVTPMIENFIRYVHKILTDLLFKLRNYLIEYSKLDTSLANDIIIIYDIELEDTLDFHMDSKYCLGTLQRLQAIYILFVSKFISYTCIILNKCKKNYQFRQKIFNKIVPTMLNELKECLKNIKLNFDKIKFSTEKKKKLKGSETPKFKFSLLSKVHKTLSYSTTNLSIILEKSEELLKKIEQMKENEELTTVAPLILDLKDHTYATYETLSTLCKFYDVFSNSQKEFKNNLPVIIPKIEIEKPARFVSYDDDFEAKEEHFKLDLTTDDEPTQTLASSPVQCSPYMGLVINELKQSLLQHQRFIDAKKRRNSEDSSGGDSVDEQPRNIPKFKITEIEGRNYCNVYPNLNLMTDDGSMTSILDSIKDFSKHLDIKEDVFGDDSEDEIEF